MHAPIDAEVLLRHSKWLAPLARALVAREDEVDDVVQSMFAPPRATPRRFAPETTAEALARAELRRRVVECVLAVAEPQRSAVILRFLEEQPVAAIARMTKAPEASVKTRVRRGIALVKELLLAETGEGDAASAAARSEVCVRLEQLAREAASSDPGSGIVGSIPWPIALALGAAAAALVTVAAIWLANGTPRRDEAMRATPAADAEPAVEPETAAPVASRVQTLARPAAPAAPVATTAAACAAALPKTGIVRGTLSDGKGHPIVGAPVWISTASSRTEVAKSWKAELADDRDAPEWRRRPRTTTGPGGRFELTGVSPFRTWRLAARAEGRGCALADQEVVFGPDRAPLEIPIELVPVVVVRGTVRDRAGRPIPEARVDVEPTGAMGEPSQSCIAGAASERAGAGAGVWSTPPLAGRGFLVSVSADGFAAPCARLEVPAELDEDEITVDVALEESGAIVMRGPVVDETGTPVDLTKRFPGFGAWNGSQEVAVAPIELDAKDATNERHPGAIDLATSRYRVAVPPDFRGALVAVMDGRVAGTVPVDDPRDPPPLVLDASLVAPVPTATLALTLVDASTRAVVDDPDVELEVQLGDAEARPVDARVTNASGGRARVRELVVPLGAASISAKWRGLAATTPRLELETAGERRAVELELVDTDACIRGRVLCVDGTPCGNETLGLYQLRGSQVVRATVPLGTNEEGFFEVAGLAAGSWFVVVRDAVVATVEAKCPPTEVELHCMPRWPVTLRFAEGDRAFDVERASFEIVDASGIPETSTRLDPRGVGDPVLATLLVPGRHSLVVRTRGRVVSRVPFEVAIGKKNEIALELAR